jgi:hypothetical protein
MLFTETASAQRAPAAPAPGEPRVTPEDLRAPVSPVFALLGTTPASIERPQTPRALTMNLISAVRDGEGLPKNYALEIAPYWTTYHPDLSFDDYYNAGVLQTIAQTFAVSIATVPLRGAVPVTGTRLGTGFKTMLRAGAAHPQLAAAHAELIGIDVRIAEASDAIPALRQRAFDARRAGRIAEADTLDKEVIAAEAAALQQTADLRRLAAETAKRVADLDRNRVGFQLAAAGASVWDFPDDRFEVRELSQWGVWITPTYRFLACRGESAAGCASSLDVMAAVRYLADRRGTADDRTWDLGGRLLWQLNPELALSLETLRRGGTAVSLEEDSTRTVVTIEYRLNDDLLLYGSFGKDFRDRPDARTLVSLVGVNFGFGRKPIVDVSRP